MPTIRLLGLPRLLFAHAYGAKRYESVLQPNPNTIEVSVITAGELIAEQDGERYVLHEGDLLCDLYRSPLHVCADGPHSHHTVCFILPFADGAPAAEDTVTLPVFLPASPDTAACRRLIDEIIRRQALSPDAPLGCAGLFLTLLAAAGEGCRRSALSCTAGEMRYVERAQRYICDNLSRPIRQQEVAQHLGITPGYLCAVFKKCTGGSVTQFINRQKLTGVRALMEKEHLPLCEAAALFGFSDPGYAGRLYRRYFGQKEK